MATAEALEAVTAEPPRESDYEHYEEIDGVRVELPPMSAFASRIASRLQTDLSVFVRTHNLGEAVAETLFRLPPPLHRSRRPDVAYISHQRWPVDRPMRLRDNAWDVVPDLVVEVVSPTDRADELMEKLSEYFQAGVRLAWVVYPRTQLVHVYTAMSDVRSFRDADLIEGRDVVPGFSLRVADLFPPLEVVPGDTEDDE